MHARFGKREESALRVTHTELSALGAYAEHRGAEASDDDNGVQSINKTWRRVAADGNGSMCVRVRARACEHVSFGRWKTAVRANGAHWKPAVERQRCRNAIYLVIANLLDM